MFTQNNTDPKRGDVRGDSSSLIDNLVEYIDNADTTVILYAEQKAMDIPIGQTTYQLLESSKTTT